MIHTYFEGDILSNTIFSFLSRFFPPSESEDQVDEPADKGRQRKYPPGRFLARGFELFHRYIDQHPDGQQKKRDGHGDEGDDCLEFHYSPYLPVEISGASLQSSTFHLSPISYQVFSSSIIFKTIST
jgi:hypothetical protein